MKTIEKGQKLQIEKEGLGQSFFINMDWNQNNKPSYEIDASAMLISESGKLEEEENFVFYNNSKSLCGGLTFQTNVSSEFKKSFQIDTSKMASNISKAMFLLTIDNGDSLNHRFGDIKDIKVVISDSNKNALLEFKIDVMSKETAIIAFEVYKRNGEWRVQGVGNGFNSGLSSILKEYGGEKIKVEEEVKRAGTFENKSEPKPLENIQLPPKVENKPSISLSKITLEKKGESTKIDLSKREGSKDIHINLNWNQVAKKAVFFRKAETIDLDLGCMYETKDGTKGVIQALGDSFGSKYNEPFIFLDKDDRSGVASDGENLYILKPELLKKAAIFCFIYEGKSDFLEAGAYLRIKGLGQEITVNLDSPRPYLTFCIGVIIENVDGVIKIQKVDEYVKGHKECDSMFGFNFKWVAGSKD